MCDASEKSKRLPTGSKQGKLARDRYYGAPRASADPSVRKQGGLVLKEGAFLKLTYKGLILTVIMSTQGAVPGDISKGKLGRSVTVYLYYVVFCGSTLLQFHQLGFPAPMML